jgi:FGFR1 oncogene partner
MRQALTASLERKGVLAKLKAELRAHVFEAVQQQGGDLGDGRGGMRRVCTSAL